MVLGLALGAPLMMRSRQRKAWQSELAATELEVAWLARDLVPSLRRTGSVEGAVGGWAVTSARVVALEDRLTGLEGQAPDEAARDRARSLRAAVRAAKARLDGLADAPAWTATRGPCSTRRWMSSRQRCDLRRRSDQPEADEKSPRTGLGRRLIASAKRSSWRSFVGRCPDRRDHMPARIRILEVPDQARLRSLPSCWTSRTSGR